jgi:NAD(P)-dependent dehydrogenase (short-subunit alcohol dehydrogenase family)
MSMANPFRFQGGVAVITGAASGIGTGLARKALSLDMRVVLADIQADALKAFAATLKGEVLAVPTDVSDPVAVEALAQRAWDTYGRVDLLFNNAGVMATGFIWEIEPERWQRSFGVNVFGILNGIRSFVPRMLKAGTPAHIVNTSSIGGFLPSPMMAPYSTTKFAVVALTESLHGEMQILQAPIGVSLLAPGPVKTGIFDDPFGAKVDPAAQQLVDVLRTMLAQQGLTPDEFAERVFAGVDRGDFWLIPQPESLDALLRQRVENILAGRNPELPQL